MASLGLSPLTMVGHSMGALIAAAWSAAHREKVGRLVLVAPAPLDGIPPGREREAAQTYQRIQARRVDPSARLADLRRSSPRALSERVLEALIEDDRSWTHSRCGPRSRVSAEPGPRSVAAPPAR